MATLALFVAGCTSEPTAQPKAPRASPTPAQSVTSPSPTASTSSPALTKAPTCTASQLQVAYFPSGSGGAAGNSGLELAIWNHGVICQLRGWPELQLLDAVGAPLATNEARTTQTFFGTASPTSVVLYRSCGGTMGCPPGIFPPAYISIAGDDVIEPCETATGIRVVMPGGSTPVDVDLRVSGSFPSGLQFCSNGKIQVLPVHG
jgi:Protein of unknown function (DUF4232)